MVKLYRFVVAWAQSQHCSKELYTGYLYVEKPEDIFTLRPRIAEEVYLRWDQERAKT